MIPTLPTHRLALAAWALLTLTSLAELTARAVIA